MRVTMARAEKWTRHNNATHLIFSERRSGCNTFVVLGSKTSSPFEMVGAVCATLRNLGVESGEFTVLVSYSMQRSAIH